MIKKIHSFSSNKTAMLLLLLVILTGALNNQSDKYQDWSNKVKLDRSIIRSDGAGYYAYLPEFFIYKDKHYSFIDSITKQYPNAKMGEFGIFTPEIKGRYNKFFPGVALCQAPFFVATHYLHSSKYHSDGYSYPYQKSVAIGAIFFLLLGVFVSYFLLLELSISPVVSAISLIAITLGTPLLFYTINEPLASHLYSFGFIAIFLYSLLKWKKTLLSKWLYFASAALGLIILLRPSNVVVILLYFSFFNNFREGLQFLKNQLLASTTRFVFSVVLVSVFVLIQIINVHYQTGNFAFNLYSNETFSNWANPPILKTLFGFKKGLFPYAPLSLIAFAGVFFTFKKYRFQTTVVLLFFALFTYITASWWCWWYGGSLGMRPMVDISVLFAIGVALLMEKSALWVKVFVLPLLIFCVHFQFVLSYQFENGILHYEAMDKDRYNYIFLKKDRRFQWMFHIETPKEIIPKKISNTFCYNENTKEFEDTNNLPKHFYTTEHIETKDLFRYEVDTNEIIKLQGIRIEGDIMLRDKNNIPILIVQAERNNEWTQLQADFIGMRVKDLHQSTHFISDFVFPEDISTYTTLLFRLDNTHGKTTVENFKLKIFEK